MNERIRELANQVGLLTHNPEDRKTKLDLFAEVLIKDAIDELAKQMWYHGIDESNNPGFYKAVEKVKQYYGIE